MEPERDSYGESEMNETSPETPRRKSALSFPVIFLGILLAIMIVGYVIRPDPSQDPHERLRCLDHLQQLSLGLALYAEENGGQWPAAQNWCDALVERFEGQGDVQGVFRCPLGGEGRCHYAMNPDADPRGPADVVLLFESKPGWNQQGGAELLITDRHQGANVLLVGGIVKFIQPGEAAQLKWKADPNQPTELPDANQL